MRAKEFTINVPINIRINGEDEVEVETPVEQDPEEENHKMVPPLQQAIELQKASMGKESEVIDDLTDDDEEDHDNDDPNMWKNNQEVWS